MRNELVFYTHPMSRGRIVRWMLEEVGQPYRTEVLGYGSAMKSPPYLAINPMGKVPTLCHGDTMAGYGCLADVNSTLDGALSGGDYILGDRFSAADVYLGSHIGWGMQFGTIDKRPTFERYWQRLSARPAAMRAKEIDDGLMAAHPLPAVKA
jgi:glutathione S-transferase